MIPLILRLKKAYNKEIAKAQDIIVQTLFEVFDKAVLHGGTAIWRCYNGNRFSEDVDVYLPKDLKKINDLFDVLEKKGLIIERKKISENSIYSSFKFNRIIVKFEAIFKKVSGSLKDYETCEGNFLSAYALTPEEIIIEKVSTYLKRLKIRDLYDIYFLMHYINDVSKIKKSLKELFARFKEPIDEKDLKVLIIEGLVPDTSKMLDYIKARM